MTDQDVAFQGMAQTQAYAMLNMADTSLLVPQNQIVSLEPIIDLYQAPSGRGNVGTLQFQGRAVPVFRLNRLMQKQQELDDDHRFSVIFESGGVYFGLLCRQMQSVNRERLIVTPIPVCMRQADMVFVALAIFDASVIKITTNSALALHLDLVQGGIHG